MSNIEIRRGQEVIASANVPDRNGLWRIGGIAGTIRTEIQQWDTSGFLRKVVLQGEGLRRHRGASKDTRTIFLKQGEGSQRISKRGVLIIKPDMPDAELAEEVVEEPDDSWLAVLWDHGWR